jgi:serine protease inhibitor
MGGRPRRTRGLDLLQGGDRVQTPVIEVDHQGTEAATVTALEVSKSSAGRSPRPLRIDRPFLFALRDRATGAPAVRRPGDAA